MKRLATIRRESITSEEIKSFTKRTAARAVVFDANNLVAILHVATRQYYKLPGGGIETGEDIIEGLRRECMEEIGCEIEILGEVGSIMEYRKKQVLAQESLCYVAKVLGQKGDPHFTKDELKDGFEIVWVSLAEAVRLVENSRPINYAGNFIVERDTILLKAVAID